MAGSNRQEDIERLVNIWPSIQLIAAGRRCHCRLASQYWFTVDFRQTIREDRIECGCWCPACGFSNACSPLLRDFFEAILWVNPERLQRLQSS
jgi:hypothetical protein